MGDGRFGHKAAAYQARMTVEMLGHIRLGDSLVLDWELSAAADHYKAAQEIAQYHLYREDVVEWIGGRLKHVADNYLLTDEEEKRKPDLEGLVL